MAIFSWYLTTQEFAMNAFYDHHNDSIRFGYRCFDRLLLNGLIQPFQQPERVVGFFNTYRQQYPVSRDVLRDIATQFQNWVANRFELGPLMLLQFRVSRKGTQKTSGKWRIDPLEQFQKHEADGSSRCGAGNSGGNAGLTNRNAHLTIRFISSCPAVSFSFTRTSEPDTRNRRPSENRERRA